MLSDVEIIRRVQRGERELFGELHTRHHSRIYRFVSHSIWQRETAQDVSGEVWLRAYNAVDRFETRPETHHDGSVLAWLLRIAANLITDTRRRLEPPSQAWDEDDEKLALQLVTPTTEREFLRREERRAIRAAFQTLSVADQQIIYLAHQHDLSSAEIAVALGKPSVSAVTSHLHRAMTHLREQLRQAGWMSEEGARAAG